MKRIVALSVLILLLASSFSFAAPLTGKKMTLGLDAPLIGWLNPNLVNKESGETISNLGINWGLGVSYRKYFEPVQTNQFNPYWEAGTFFIILPYIGIGGDYVWSNGFYLGGGIIWLFPEIHGGFMF